MYPAAHTLPPCFSTRLWDMPRVRVSVRVRLRVRVKG